MGFVWRSLSIADVLKIAADSACDESKLARLSRTALSRLSTRFFIDAEQNEYLLQIPGDMREDRPTYYFFAAGYLFEIHRVRVFSNEFSFIRFPPQFESLRDFVRERFTLAITCSNECMGWFEGTWADLSDELRARVMPVFINDDIPPDSM